MQTLVLLVSLFVLGVVSLPHSNRFLHASVDYPPMDIYLQENPVVLGLNFATPSEYILIDANVSQSLQIKVANDYVAGAGFTIPKTEFNASNPQTVIIYGFFPHSLHWTIIDQHCTPHGRGAWVNAYHLYNGLENVDISINAAAVCTGKDPNSDRLLWRDVAYQKLTDMKLLPTPSKSPFNVTVNLTRVPHPEVWMGQLTAQAGHTYTLVAIGENVVDRFSSCSSRGTGYTSECPQYSIRSPAWIFLDSGFSSTCSLHYP